MTGLPQRALGRTGLEVSVLGFGAMEVGAPGRVGDAEAGRLLNAVLDAGINFIDTSIDYGLSEEWIGRFIGHRRPEYLLASKCGCVPGSITRDHANTPENIRAGVEHSLRTLRTDCLDLVQLHQSLSRRVIEESGVLETLLRLRQEGKVRFIGVSGVLPNLIEQIQMGAFATFQIPYSALQREHEALIYLASGLGAGIIIRGAVGGGIGDDRAARDRWTAAHLDELLQGMSRHEFMLRFTLANPDLDTAIVGTRSIEHLRENVAIVAKGPLPPETVAEAKRRLASEKDRTRAEP
jgi:aryl-alcohol dehydrogenase-like predicted oxidoreductase